MTEFGVAPKSIGSYLTPAPTPTLTVTAAAPAAAPAVTYEAVGATGPGGGIIFYVNTAGFACGPTLATRCNYLEVAPSGWNTGADPSKAWATGSRTLGNANQNVSGVDPQTDINLLNLSSQIGLGYKNSIAIVDQITPGSNGTTTAAGAARAYLGGGKNDWYLPTTAELNLLCQWNRGVAPSVTTACSGGSLNSAVYGASATGLRGSDYWSSSEYTNIRAWYQYFGSGVQEKIEKDYILTYIRPVRAF